MQSLPFISTMLQKVYECNTTPLRYFHPRQYLSVRLKNALQGFPWQLSMQPVSRDWIGLDTRMCRGETPIRQVNEKYIKKINKLQIHFLPRRITPTTRTISLLCLRQRDRAFASSQRTTTGAMILLSRPSDEDLFLQNFTCRFKVHGWCYLAYIRQRSSVQTFPRSARPIPIMPEQLHVFKRKTCIGMPIPLTHNLQDSRKAHPGAR